MSLPTTLQCISLALFKKTQSSVLQESAVVPVYNSMPVADRDRILMPGVNPPHFFIGRLEYSNVLRVVDQILTFASYLIE